MYELPDGSGFFVAEMKRPHFFKHWFHKLFQCPTFWQRKAAFECLECGKHYRCYWDGNDVEGRGINLCDKCVKR